MSFKELLSRAKDDDLQAKETLLERYKSLLLKEAITSAAKDRKAKDGGRNWKRQRDDAVICA